jgi:adenylate cyclase
MNKHTIKILLSGLSILIGLVVLRIIDPYFIETTRLKGLDYYQRQQKKVESNNIVVVEIDEATLDKFGQWPVSRAVLSEGLEKAFNNGAQIVVMPILFSEKDRLGGDAIFNMTLQKYPVITAQSASQKGKGNPVPRGLATIGDGLGDWLYTYPAAIGPTKEIGQSSAGVGMLLTAPELDGVVRRLPLVIKVKGEVYPTIPLEALRLFGGEESYQAKVNEGGIQAIRVKGTPPIVTDANARVWLNFKYKFNSISFANTDWSKVKDKIVIISLTAEGLNNTVATPVGISQGYEVSAQALQMLIDNSRLQRPSTFDLYELTGGIILAIILIVAACYFLYTINGVLIILALCVPYFIGSRLFVNNGYLLDYTWPTLAVLLPWVGALFFRFVMEFKLKQQIKKQFGTYLSPALVNRLQKNPSILKLGGDERELSIMFTDVRGFTSISEHYGKDVQGLTQIMNRYMTAMTKSILANDGTLDKYIGDAQMAFWNAPLDDQDHARNAVKTALQMLNSLDEFNKEISKEGIPAFGMGIGINTASVVVGNMGSSQRFDYTCLGDGVNLASRLEGQSKPYGVRIIIGPLTREKIRGSYTALELDCIAVKGKKEGVKIYTVLENKIPDNPVEVMRMHEAFLITYREQKWVDAIALSESLKKYNPELKKYYEMMQERIQELKQSNLPADWDGVYRATSK